MEKTLSVLEDAQAVHLALPHVSVVSFWSTVFCFHSMLPLFSVFLLLTQLCFGVK